MIFLLQKRDFASAAGRHAALFGAGAAGYGGLELLWRGSTHWTMLLAGGVCLLALGRISRTALAPALQCLLGSLCITGVELAAGLVCNCLLRWNIWSYADEWGNLYGQICPLYSALWYLLCIPVLAVLRHAPRLPAAGRPLHRPS